MKRIGMLKGLVSAFVICMVLFCNFCYADEVMSDEPYYNSSSELDFINLVAIGAVVIIIVGFAVVLLVKSSKNNGFSTEPVEAAGNFEPVEMADATGDVANNNDAENDNKE